MKYLIIPAFKFLYAVFMTIWAIITTVIIIPIYITWNAKLPGKDFYQIEINKGYTFRGNSYSPYFKIPDDWLFNKDAEPIIFKSYLHFFWNIKMK